ncbi:neutral zinc metallopeptidase, partial [Mesorhizobium sp. M7A.T.Ca.US.000.02.2.1]
MLWRGRRQSDNIEDDRSGGGGLGGGGGQFRIPIGGRTGGGG